MLVRTPEKKVKKFSRPEFIILIRENKRGVSAAFEKNCRKKT